MNVTEGTEIARGAFLRALSHGASVTKACEAAGLSRTHAYRMRDDKGVFAAAWEEALREWADRSVDILVDRIMYGAVEVKEIEEHGVVTRVEHMRRPDDRLALALVKRYQPEFRDDRTLHIEHGGQVSATVTHELSQPRHVLETWVVTLEYNPAYREIAATMLPAGCRWRRRSDASPATGCRAGTTPAGHSTPPDDDRIRSREPRPCRAKGLAVACHRVRESSAGKIHALSCASAPFAPVAT